MYYIYYTIYDLKLYKVKSEINYLTMIDLV